MSRARGGERDEPRACNGRDTAFSAVNIILVYGDMYTHRVYREYVKGCRWIKKARRKTHG